MAETRDWKSIPLSAKKSAHYYKSKTMLQEGRNTRRKLWQNIIRITFMSWLAKRIRRTSRTELESWKTVAIIVANIPRSRYVEYFSWKKRDNYVIAFAGDIVNRFQPSLAFLLAFSVSTLLGWDVCIVVLPSPPC